jgi:hypothetical protein
VGTKPIGSGSLDLNWYGAGTATSGRLGGELSLEMRPKKNLSVFALGRSGLEWSPQTKGELWWETLGGVRYQW